MTIDPNMLTIILGLITNGITSLISQSNKEIGDLIIGKEFHEKWELEKTALITVLRTTISDMAENIELKEPKGEEIISLFLLSPEVEDVVRQIYSLQFVRDDNEQKDFQSIRVIFLSLFSRFIASYPSEVAPRQEQVVNISNLLLDKLINLCNLALSTAVDKGILAAHEAQSIFRHNILYSEIRAIQKKLNFLTSQQQLDIHAIFEFEKKYRQQLVERHGYITPPDFDTARQIPIDDLYVSPTFSDMSLINQQDNSFPLNTFLSRIYRAVLLGNPGGGKSTFTLKLCHDLAVHHSQRLLAGRQELTPILVVLRNYGVEKKERRCSILEFIKMETEAIYQLPTPPEGAFEYLILNGRAIVIFDGLDELLDTSYRQEIRNDVQSFCNLYPSVPVLVTSRKIGYEQAPLNEHLFEVFNLEPLEEDQVKEYVQKWFTLADFNIASKKRQQKIVDFLKESQTVIDLRSNALMLALMCNIYRGENYIPKNRPDIYEKCATMLFERWDRSRNLRISLPFEVHIRPTMMYIANWIYTNSELRGGVTEKMLITKAKEYLLQKRFEDPDEAEAAAQEFIIFCRGRAWIFTDIGTEKSGERLYQFTHQTFLEYFTAAYFVRTHPTPETLLNILFPRIARREWDVVAQLAFQIQNKNFEDAGDKLLNMLLTFLSEDDFEECLNILSFAVRCLSFIVPNPKVTRVIVRKSIEYLVAQGNMISKSKKGAVNAHDMISIIRSLKESAAENVPIISDELEKSFTAIISSEDEYEGYVPVCLIDDFSSESDVSEWHKTIERIFLNCSSKLDKILSHSIYLSYNAVWNHNISISKMIKWHGFVSLFADTSLLHDNIYNVRGYGGCIAEAIIHNILYKSRITSIYQMHINILNELGQNLFIYEDFRSFKPCPVDLQAIRNLINLTKLKEGQEMANLENRAFFGLFILFAILLESYKLIKSDFNFELIKKPKHPFYKLLHWTFLARFEQVESKKIDAEMKRCQFLQEQQDIIQRWIRNEINFVKKEDILFDNLPSEIPNQ